ncbi:MAG: F0F1 ATP synthase subunit delta [Candidatus Omnitrophota bacterium]|nr:F0F1 ATP synthase subunit delta [Candidatus Omnitrophota bacterium]
MVALLILQLLIFGVLIFVFRKIMSQNIVSATQHLSELSKDYAEKEKKINQQLEESRHKAQELLAKAQEEAEKIKAQVVQEAQQERDKILQEARNHGQELVQQAEKSRQQLLSELEERISKEATRRACELIQGTLPESFRQLAHTHWVEDLIESDFTHIERLRIPDDLREAKIISAFSLSAEERQKLTKKLKSALGREVTLKEEVDAKVVVGLIINIGSLTLDGSLENKIREQARV